MGFLVVLLLLCLVAHPAAPEEVLLGVFPVVLPLDHLEGTLVVPLLVHLEVNTVVPPLVRLVISMVVRLLLSSELFLVVQLLRVNISVFLAASLLVHPMFQDQVYLLLYHLEVSIVDLLGAHPLRVNMVRHLQVYTVGHPALDFLVGPQVQEELLGI